MEQIEVIPMELVHIDEVMIVEDLSFTVPWSKNAFEDELKRNKHARYIVARIRGKVVGYAGMWKVIDEAHITNIAVHPVYRGQGVGSRLMESLLQIAELENIIGMTLEVRRSNLTAQSLYMKYDFKFEGVRKAYYSDNGEDALIMWKKGIQSGNEY